MSEKLDRILEQHFRGTSNEALIDSMENAPDFGYDDEQYELNRRLALGGLAWRWAANNKVEVYPTMEGGDES